MIRYKIRLAALEIQPQTGEDAEKMELAAKLINSEFGKFERELRNSNDKWLWGWTTFFAAIVAIVVTVIGFALWFSIKSLIADRVEKSLNEFKDAVKQVGILKGQLRVFRKEQAAFLLEATFLPDLGSELGFPKENKERREEALKEISEEALLDVFSDEKYLLAVRHKAAEVLAQKFPPLVAPLLQLLNSAIDPDSNIVAEIGQNSLRNSVSLLGQIHTQESYKALKTFLIRLLTDNPKNKDLFLKWTAFSLGWVSIKLNMEDSVSVLRLAISHLQVGHSDLQALKNFARYFDVFNEPEGIKEILTHHAFQIRCLKLEEKCLELLEKYDADFVKEWKAQKATILTQKARES